MGTIKRTIENNFSLLLLIGVVIGFFTPSFGAIADEIVIFLTASLILLSCADIKAPDFQKIDIFQIALFSFLRFGIFPLGLFYAVYQVLPDYAIGILLLSLMPAGVAVGSLCSMARSNVALGIGLTILSSLLAPAFVPSVFSFLGQIVNVDIWALFLTLILVVLVPIALYFGVFSRHEKIKNLMRDYNKSTSIVILSFVLVVVIGTQKETFLEDLSAIYIGLAVMTLLYAVFYIFGIVYACFLEKGQRIPFILASGANNNSLAVGLAFAYFEPAVTLFIVLSEIVWSFYVAGAQWVFSKLKN
jgi:BASS family bile acid:Na+ symporter